MRHILQKVISKHILMVQQLLLIFCKIIISLVEIIKTVGCLGLYRLAGSLFQFAFLMLCILQAYILQGADGFFLPALENLISVLEAGLSCLNDCAAAGFLDKVHSETVFFRPGIASWQLPYQ